MSRASHRQLSQALSPHLVHFIMKWQWIVGFGNIWTAKTSFWTPTQQAVPSDHWEQWWCWKGYHVFNYHTSLCMTWPKRCTGRSDNRHAPATYSSSNWSIVLNCIIRYRDGRSLCDSLWAPHLSGKMVMSLLQQPSYVEPTLSRGHLNQLNWSFSNLNKPRDHV